MSLVQLLAVGRSLGKVQDEPSRYKMTQQNLLPKFGLTNVPETKAAPEDLAAENVPGKLIEQNTIRKIAPPSVTTHAPAKPGIIEGIRQYFKKNMNTVEPEPAVQPAPSPAMPKPTYPLGRWTLFANPFSKAAKPKAALIAQQGELSLDTVKPVRNDLSDSDIEVVMPGRAMSTEKQLPNPVQVPPERVEPVWARVRTQMEKT